MKVTLTKIGDNESAPNPNPRENGKTWEGAFRELPQVGKHFWVGVGYKTSKVQEILPDNKFRTYNSIYQYQIHE